MKRVFKFQPKVELFLLALVWLPFLQGCATLFAPHSDKIKFDSEPQGAEVYIDGQKVGVTPCSVFVKRQTEGSPQVAFKANGYKPERFDLVRVIAPVALFNLGFISTTSGVTSWGIDAASGKMFEYQPKAYFFELEKKETVVRSSPSAPAFVAKNFEELRRELAEGEGTFLTAYLALADKLETRSEFEARIKANASELLLIESPSELHAKLDQLLKL